MFPISKIVRRGLSAVFNNSIKIRNRKITYFSSNFIDGINLDQGGRKQIFYGGLIVYSGKLFFQKLQNLLNKSPKDGGA